MKRNALTLLLCLIALGMNAERSFITDAAYRGQVKQAYTKKLAQLKLDFSKESACHSLRARGVAISVCLHACG